MLDRAHLFTSFSSRISSPVLASALVLAALTGACTKTESASAGTSTASTGTAAPSAGATATAATAAVSDAAVAPADPTAATTAGADATAPTASGAASGTKPTTSAAASASVAAGGAAECGTKPLPDCPLQGWMKANMNPAMADKDFTALATALDKAATFAPAGYTNWASIAKDGAKAARAQDMTATKASCRTCHDQYKDKFKKDTALRAKKI